ncbi:MAG: hypothetical protein QM736_05030 [Vicinamibacterales bacterium]
MAGESSYGTDRTRACPGWLRRIVEWFATSSRYAVWLAALVGAALFAGYLIRVARDVDAGDDVGLVLTPSHVRDLDIRPESLPADVGAAARDLWERGEHRQAMALLYRAALSRLVHVHRVPVRDSSTEGDCLDARTSAPRCGLLRVSLTPRARLAASGVRPPRACVGRRHCAL